MRDESGSHRSALAPLSASDEDLRWSRWLRRVVVFMIVLVCLGPPLIFNVRQVKELQAELVRDAYVQSRIVARFALEFPDRWTARPDKLQALLADVLDRGMRTSVTVVDRTLVDAGDVLQGPLVSARHDIVVHGENFGYLTVTRSLRSRLPAMAAFLGAGFTLATLALLGLYRQIFRRLDAAESARRLVQQRLADIAELSADWFWEHDAEGRYTIHTLEGRMGWQRSPLTGRCLWELSNHTPEPLWDRHRLDLAARKPFVLRAGFDTEVGLRWYEISGKPVFDLNGAFTGYRGTGRDITRDQLREQEIARHRDELQKRLEAY